MDKMRNYTSYSYQTDAQKIAGLRRTSVTRYRRKSSSSTSIVFIIHIFETTKSKIISLNTKTYTHKSILEQWQMYKNVTKSHVQLYSKNPPHHSSITMRQSNSGPRLKLMRNEVQEGSIQSLQQCYTRPYTRNECTVERCKRPLGKWAASDCDINHVINCTGHEMFPAMTNWHAMDSQCSWLKQRSMSSFSISCSLSKTGTNDDFVANIRVHKHGGCIEYKQSISQILVSPRSTLDDKSFTSCCFTCTALPAEAYYVIDIQFQAKYWSMQHSVRYPWRVATVIEGVAELRRNKHFTKDTTETRH